MLIGFICKKKQSPSPNIVKHRLHVCLDVLHEPGLLDAHPHTLPAELLLAQHLEVGLVLEIGGEKLNFVLKSLG